MRDFINIGSSPTGEPCAQVGQANYEEQSRKECQAFIHQLKRVFGEPPGSAHLSYKSFPHDFGSYKEVVCYYRDDDEEAMEYAFKLEGETLEYWDNEAKKELGLVSAATAASAATVQTVVTATGPIYAYRASRVRTLKPGITKEDYLTKHPDARIINAPPDNDTLASWLADGCECEALDGCHVELDGTCSHGLPSWILAMGMI